MKKYLITIISAMLLTSCANTNTESNSEINDVNESTEVNEATEATDTTYSGELTIVTNFTNTEESFGKIITDFGNMYPDVTLNFESTSSDYDEYITTRMTSGDYGDILMIPFSLTNKPTELGTFLEPLGTTEEISKTYSFADQAVYEGNTYALPISLNSLGILYNENVFNEAGVSVPTSPEEVYEVSEKILENTDAIPFYSNLNSMPFFWSGATTSYGGEQYQSEILKQGTIMEEGQPYREMSDFLYNMIVRGYTEEDLMAGDPGESMNMVANGDAGFIIMGSMLLEDIMSMSETPEAIKMAPFPVQYEGVSYMPLGADALIGISSKSEQKELARVFYDYLLSAESGFAFSNGGFTPLKDGNSDAPEFLNYQVTEYDTIRTIANEDTATIETFMEISQKANIPSYKSLVPEVLEVGYHDEDYQAWIDDVESRWQNALAEME